MKKSAGKLILFGTAAAAAVNFSACHNAPETVYGPPSYFGVDGEDDFESESNIPEAVYGPPSYFGIEEEDEFNPENNIPEDVYGPPSYFGLYEEDEEAGGDEESLPDESDLIESAQQDPATAEYDQEESGSREPDEGPAGRDGRDESEETADAYVSPTEETTDAGSDLEVFSPEDNVMQLMYGPPSMMGSPES